MSVHRQFLVVGATPTKRSRFAASAVQHAQFLGWRGNEYLVNFSNGIVGMFIDGSSGEDALAVAVTGSILERLGTARAVSSSYADAIIMTDFFGCWPYYSNNLENHVLQACEKCYSGIRFNAVVSCVPLNEIRDYERSWLKAQGLDIIDMADSPRSFGTLILRG